MLPTIETTVLPGGRIEISSPDLKPGRKVTIWIMPEVEQAERRSPTEILADYPGGQLFKTAEEVEAYLREERDSWA